MLRDRLFESRVRRGASTTAASSSRGRVLADGEVAALARRARATQRVGVHVRGRGAPAPARSTASASPTADGAAAYVDVETLGRRRRGGPGRLAGRPGEAEGLARREGARARAGRPRAGRWPGSSSDTALAAYLARPDQRSYDLADLTAPLPQARAERARPKPTRAPLRRRRRPPTPRRPRCCTPAPCSTSPRRSTASSRSAAERACSTEVELPLVHLLAADGADRHRRRRRPPRVAGGDFDAEVRNAAEEAYAVIGKEINLGSPKQLQVVLFDELGMPKTKRTKTGYTTDADALQALSSRPSTRSCCTCCGTATSPGCARPSRVCSRRSPRRPDPHHVQPDDRRDRPALQHRAEPAEHPGPHRGGPPDPRGLRRRPGLRVADDGRLQPDRDADHGAPVRGRSC